jgi:lambda family phage portal protein
VNPIDRVVMFFAPEAGKRRLAARKQADAMMNYDGASRGARTAGWKAPYTSADAAAYGQRGLLRQRSRDMVRNRALAARAKDVVVTNVVGQGIVPSVNAASADVAERVKGLVDRHLLTPDLCALGEYDLYEMQSIVMSTVFTDGEVLARRRVRNPVFNPNLALPFQIELLEVDYLDHSVQRYGENHVVEGVEYGPTGAIEAYHLYNEHPGAVITRKVLTSTRVPWQDVLHIRRFDRPGQLRGVPWLAPVMLTLADLSDYVEAQILKQRMAALMAVLVEWEEGKRPKDANGLETLSPGAVVNLPEGATATFSNPPSVAGFGEFMRFGMATVAVGIGITLESLSGDLKGVNYSSGRMGRMEHDRLVKAWQSQLIVGQFCRGVGRWMREAMALSPEWRGVEFGLEWTPPRRILVDPSKEIPAMVAEIDAGLASRQHMQRELAYDPARVRREREEDQRLDAAAGLRPVGASAQGIDDGEDDPADDDSGDDVDPEDGARSAGPVPARRARPGRSAPDMGALVEAIRAMPAPVVNVAPAPVTVNVPPRAAVRRDAVFNDNGQITGMIEREVDQ